MATNDVNDRQPNVSQPTDKPKPKTQPASSHEDNEAVIQGYDPQDWPMADDDELMYLQF